jgi:hypothetical protein
VDFKILCIGHVLFWAVVAHAFASVITPLGLSDEIVATTPRSVPFEYMPDKYKTYGFGTSPRNDYTFSRICGLFGSIVPCPSQPWPEGLVQTKLGLLPPYDGYIANVSSAIPQKLTDIFQSHTKDNKGTSISNLFDIQYRSYSLHYDRLFPQKNVIKAQSFVNIDEGRDFVVGNAFRFYDVLINRPDLILIEGLVVDTVTGGVGFRNHTAPVMSKDLRHGAEWHEDLLWIKPETVCVDTNLTIEFQIKRHNGPNRIGAAQYSLVDKGGFRNMTKQYPKIDFSNNQADPKLYMRAFKAATFNNLNVIKYFNLLTEGKRMDTLLPEPLDVTTYYSTVDFDPTRPYIGRFAPDSPLPGLRSNSSLLSNKTIIDMGTSFHIR